jgi:hypothetical protein
VSAALVCVLDAHTHCSVDTISHLVVQGQSQMTIDDNTAITGNVTLAANASTTANYQFNTTGALVLQDTASLAVRAVCVCVRALRRLTRIHTELGLRRHSRRVSRIRCQDAVHRQSWRRGCRLGRRCAHSVGSGGAGRCARRHAAGGHRAQHRRCVRRCAVREHDGRVRVDHRRREQSHAQARRVCQRLEHDVRRHAVHC